MGADRIGGIGDRASVRQAAGVRLTAGSLARIGARGGTRGTWNK